MTYKTEWLDNFKDEIQSILDKVYEIYKNDFKLDNWNHPNVKGKIMSKQVQVIENEFLQAIIKNLKEIGMGNNYVMCYDGIMVPKYVFEQPFQKEPDINSPFFIQQMRDFKKSYGLLDGIKYIEAQLFKEFGVHIALKNKQMENIKGLKNSIFKTGPIIQDYRVPIDGYFIEVNLHDIKKKRAFPLATRMTKEGVREFNNDIRGNGIWLDMISAKDLIEFQGASFDILRGYYFDQGRNDRVNSFIRELFELRKQKKDEGNKIQEVYKLILNSFYGKLIQNPIKDEYKFFFGKKKFDKFLNFNFNQIESYVMLPRGVYYVKIAKSTLKHFSMPHCGSEVLSYSKHLMNKVTCLAEDIGIKINYMDTDSMHYANTKKFEVRAEVRLAQAYQKKYGEKLLGSKLGQMHSDFDVTSNAATPYAIKSLYLGKKSYIEMIETKNKDADGNIITEIVPNIKLKGIPKKCIESMANNRFNGDYHALYKAMFNGQGMCFNLTNVCKFKVRDCFLTSNTLMFLRKVHFAAEGESRVVDKWIYDENDFELV